MKKIMLIDTNYGFTSDIESRLILDDIDDIEVITRGDINSIHDEIEREKPDELLIAANLINSHPNWDFGIPVKTYCRNSEGIDASHKKGFPTYGVVNGAGALITAIAENKLVKFQNTPQPSPSQKPNPNKPKHSPNNQPKRPADPTQRVKRPPLGNPRKPQSQPKPQPKPKPQPIVEEYDDFEDDIEVVDQDYVEDYQVPGYSAEELDNIFEDDEEDDYIPTPQPMSRSARRRQQQQAQQQQQQRKPQAQVQTRTNSRSSNIKAKLEEAKRREEEERKRQEALRKKKAASLAELEVERDLGNIQDPAHVITVYSAKGGVGKTTLSCEIAAYLSLTSHGRGKFKVCVADFNIDFGDVMNTLNFDPERACMTLWAADIRERLAEGQNPEDIQYTEGQISVYLQTDERTGLCALLAPMTNEDSMDIADIEIEIMLDNLINNGGFDFVVCDTGNNTRDSSFIPLEKSDDVIMVLTQSVNTANCNAGFLNTVAKIGFDLDKIKVVINKTQAAKSVGISVDELIEAFVNPQTGEPFEVLGIIKENSDVTNANNNGEPLIYQSSHEFTRSVGEIVSQLIGETFELEAPEKLSFFKRLFRR